MTQPPPPDETGPHQPSDDPLLDAGLGAAFGPDSGPPIPAGSSVLAALGYDLPAPPQVHLREPETDAITPVNLPDSPEMPKASAPAGTTPRLQLLGEIARGGMGAILKGRDVDLGRDVAVKVLLETHQGKTELAQRFVEEAQIAGQLQHPGVVPVYELGVFADRRPYFTMKLVKGKTLAALLAARKDPAEERAKHLGVFLQVCQTLAYAHARGVIHRDLKPSNVMVGAYGEVQVMDWGLAKVLREGGTADEAKARPPQEVSVIRTARSGSGGTPEVGSDTQAGTLLGTPAYMAPEQARGEIEDVDRRSDVFGLGAVLCEVLTGKPPYAGPGEAALKQSRRADLADAFARLDGCGADAELISLAKRCLSADLAGRPRDAGETASAVTAYRESVERRLRQAEVAAAEARAKAAEERKRRRLRLALAASVLLLLAAAAAGGGWYAWDRAARRAEAELVLQKAEAAGDAALARADQAEEEARGIEREADRAASDEPGAPDAAKQAWALWQKAGDAAGEAEAVLRTAPGAMERRRRAAARRQEIEAESARADKEVKLLDALDRARALRNGSSESAFDYGSAAQSYAAALALIGVNISDPESQAAAAIRARRPAIRLALLVALDDWASFVLDEGPEAARLRRIADLADDDPWRHRFRAAVGDLDELKRLAEEARRLELSAVNADALALALMKRGARAEAATGLRQARRLHPADFWVHFDLGFCLHDLEHPDPAKLNEAAGCYWAAVALRPGCAGAHNNLGNVLYAEGDLEGAVAAYRKGIEIDPASVYPHSNLGGVLHQMGDLEGALAECRKAIELDPKFALAHHNLGSVLYAKGDKDGAIAAFRKAIQTSPRYAPTHSNLGAVLDDKGDVEGALEECRKAIELDPRLAAAHLNLGNALLASHDIDGAVAAYRKAADLDPADPRPLYQLPLILLAQGKFAEARDAARRCLDLLGPDAPLRPKALEHLQKCERLLAQEAKVGRVLRGEQQPTGAELGDLIQVCQIQRRNAAAAGVYRRAFAADATLAADPFESHRYNAAGYAALAGCSEGEDAKELDDAERAGWRKQAVDWLRADLALLTKRLASADAAGRHEVAATLRDWREDFALSTLRDPAELAKLPADEQEACKELWADVQALLDKAEPKK